MNTEQTRTIAEAKAKVFEIAAKETEIRRLETYGGGQRRKPVQVSTIPDIDHFVEKSEAIAKALDVDGRSLAAIIAVSLLHEILGLEAIPE